MNLLLTLGITVVLVAIVLVWANFACNISDRVVGEEGMFTNRHMGIYFAIALPPPLIVILGSLAVAGVIL